MTRKTSSYARRMSRQPDGGTFNGARVPPRRITAMCVGVPTQAEAASSARRRFAA